MKKLINSVDTALAESLDGLAAADTVHSGPGVLFIVKNYEGDVMIFDMAREMCAMETAVVLTNDDVAVEDSLYTTGRRAVAGTLIVEKVLGAAAEQGVGSRNSRRWERASTPAPARWAWH